MHDQYIGIPGEIDEFWICAGLIGTEDDRSGWRLDPVGEGRHVRMGYSERSHGQVLPLEHGRGFCLRYVNDANIKTHPGPLGCAERTPQHLKRAVLLVEQTREKRRKI